MIPVTGWAARRFGAKRVYMTSLVLFTAGSALCAMATSTTALVLFRVLQGAGGGMIMPLGQLIMAQVAGPQRMGRVMGDRLDAGDARRRSSARWSAALILENLHWSWIFLVNVPIGMVAFILGWRDDSRTPSPGEAGQPRRARPGRCCSSASAAIVYGLRAARHATASLTRADRRLADRRRVVLSVRLRAGTRCASSARCWTCACMPTASSRPPRSTTFALGAALFGAMILVPLYYQEVRHESVIVTGLLAGPQGLGMLW